MGEVYTPQAKDLRPRDLEAEWRNRKPAPQWIITMLNVGIFFLGGFAALLYVAITILQAFRLG